MRHVISHLAKQSTGYYLYGLPVVLFFIFISMVAANEEIEREIRTYQLLPLPEIPFEQAVYPQLVQRYTPTISAQAAVVMDDASKVILYEKNADLRNSLASTTKLMTALTALDYFALNDILTIYDTQSEGTVVGFRVGEKFYFEDLLFALLLPSGNDAALAIGQNYPGGVEAFVAQMNEKAKSLHLYNTHFYDPTGLTDEYDYTTARDLVRLASYAMSSDVVAHIVSQKQKVITTANGSQSYSLSNLNKLLGVAGVDGIKTGFTYEAGGVLATSKIEKGKRFIIVVMKSLDRFSDTQELLSLISNNVSYAKL